MRNSFIAIVLSGVSVTAMAGSRDQAKRIHDRVAGIPPSEAVLTQMAALIDQGNAKGAAAVAIENEAFLKITVKNLATTWTTMEKSVDAPLNDYSATVIGFVRDDLDVRRLTSDDLIYTAADGLTGVAVYSPLNNTHYANFEAGTFSYKTQLVQKPQATTTTHGVAAGVLTLRGFGETYYQAGTNRRAFEAVVNTFLCKKMEQMHDVTRPDGYVRRDVDRAPGGNPVEYRNKCAGCHSGMDPLSKAFAHIDFVPIGTTGSRIVYDEATIPAKLLRNADTFPGGYEYKDDQWVNMWTEGQNAVYGWKGAATGAGLKSFGEMIAATDRFGDCMAETVFARVCLHPATTDSEKVAFKKMTADFKAGGYKMKGLFADSAVACMGE